MWYEILPSMAIITVALAVPPTFGYFAHKLIYKGNPYRREITKERMNLTLYRRDLFFGNPYVRRGLENIPDN